MDFDWITSIESAATVAALVFAAVSLLCSTSWIFWPRPHTASVKLIGSLMVLAMAFAANHWAVYALAIFITATLVTELEFLERLAAIFWGRDKYFDYLKGRATTVEKELVVQAEAVKELAAEAEQQVLSPGPIDAPGEGVSQAEPTEAAGEPPPAPSAPNAPVSQTSGGKSIKIAQLEGLKSRLKEIVSKAREFESQVKEALSKSLQQPADLTFDVSLRRRADGKPTMVLDAVIETPLTVYVIEIKNSTSPPIVHDAAQQLERYCAAYAEFLEQRGVSKPVVPVGIFPTPGLNWRPPGKMVPISFDEQTRKFVGTERLMTGLLSVPPF